MVHYRSTGLYHQFCFKKQANLQILLHLHKQIYYECKNKIQQRCNRWSIARIYHNYYITDWNFGRFYCSLHNPLDCKISSNYVCPLLFYEEKYPIKHSRGNYNHLWRCFQVWFFGIDFICCIDYRLFVHFPAIYGFRCLNVQN